MAKYICIHGHFYQPPRENPWLEVIELQDSAYPYHDWNESITVQCYDPNAASRILGPDGTIIDITDNYQRISFNFGPTLLSWMESKSPETLKAVISSDMVPEDKFSGHRNAIAQAYNHIIMPLASSRDKRTQVIWGIREFEHRFNREPEAMWFPETAVDLESLDMMAEHGMKYVILAPHQVCKVRKIGDEAWTEVANGGINTRMPYLCNLKSGRSIAAFAYDGPISKDVAFSDLLNNGENFAGRLVGAFDQGEEGDQLVHIATDGETYGHHHLNGDMALAYCLYYLESKGLAKITDYGEYLENHPPTHEVEILENTAWSCVHGVERWRSDCGCNTGGHPAWNQKWRAPLRLAMDWLRDQLAAIYEREAAPYLKDPWQARDDYIYVILDRSVQNVSKYLTEHSVKDLSQDEKVRVLKLLGMQRQALRMYTSCGWFFDEISGIETTQVMKYAARAMQLARDVSGVDLEPEYKKILTEAQSNIPGFGNGAEIYEKMVKPAAVDLYRVTAHYAISSIFTKYSPVARIFSYTVDNLVYDLEEMGINRLAIGKVRAQSELTWEEEVLSFAVVYFDGHYVSGGVRKFSGDENFEVMRTEIKDPFSKSNIPDVLRFLDKHFGDHNFGLWHLFKDEQRRIFERILEPHLKEIAGDFRQLYDHDYTFMQVMKGVDVPLPEAMIVIRKLVLNGALKVALEEENIEELQKAVDEIKRWPVDLDVPGLTFTAGRKIERLMERLRDKPEDINLLQTINYMARALNDVHLQPSLWKSQNILFSLSKQYFSGIKARAEKGDDKAKMWLDLVQELENFMHVRIP